ncbi:MAG: acetoacetate decarboxylase family protein [Dehalococcoidia bacterium]|nr:acetoacetate decarboxylase family protein [Dehalococcoidia bacterium]
MPDLGRLRRDRLPHALPATSPLYPPPPWSLPGARTLKVVFETDAETALNWLPPSLGRTSPAYGIITATHYPESPIGPFSLAAQYIGCRARMFIRAFALHAVADSARAVVALRELWGYPATLGSVRLRAGPRSARATIAAGGQALTDLRLSDGEPCDPALIRFDPVLNLRLISSIQPGKRHALLEMVQLDPDYTIADAVRGRPHLAYPAAEGNPWRLLPALSMISAAYTVGDTELPLARFVMPY